MNVLHWSEKWAEVVGGDGHIITDLLGRVAPCWTDEDANRLAQAWRSGHRQDVEKAAAASWDVAHRNGLNSAVACARQSAGRVVGTHAPFDRDVSGGDLWHRWQPAGAILEHTVAGLVLRRVAEPKLVERLTAPWVDVFGALPPFVDTDTEQAQVACPTCEQPRNVRVVTEAAAAAYARKLRRYDELDNEQLKADLTEVRRSLADARRENPSWEAVDAVLRRALDSAPKLAAVTRRHIEAELKLTPAADAPVEVEGSQGGSDKPRQAGLFDMDAAS